MQFLINECLSKPPNGRSTELQPRRTGDLRRIATRTEKNVENGAVATCGSVVRITTPRAT
eukprot:2995051-Prymnesium_polylepis.1